MKANPAAITSQNQTTIQTEKIIGSPETKVNPVPVDRLRPSGALGS
jgi:hypothetical protein